MKMVWVLRFVMILLVFSIKLRAQTVPVNPPKPISCFTSKNQIIQCGGTWVDYNPANGLTYDCICKCVASWNPPDNCTPRSASKTSTTGSTPPGNTQEVLGITHENHNNVTLQGYYTGEASFTKTPVDATESWTKENENKENVFKSTSTPPKLFIKRKAVSVRTSPIPKNRSGNKRLDNKLDNDRLYFKNNKSKNTQRIDSKSIIEMNKQSLKEKQNNYEIALRQQNINVTSSNMIVGNMQDPSLYDFTKAIAIPLALGTAVAFAAPAGILLTLAAGAVIGVSTKNLESAAKCLMVDMPANNPCEPGEKVMLSVNTYTDVAVDVVLGAAFTPILKPIVKYGLVGKGFGMDLRTKAAERVTDITTDITSGKSVEVYKEQLKESVKIPTDNRSNPDKIYYWKEKD
jgi:hypothetical protein